MKLPPDIVTHTHRGMRLLALAACGLMAAAAPGLAQNPYKSSAEYQNYEFNSYAEKQQTLAYIDQAIADARKSQSVFHDPQAERYIRDLEDTRRFAASRPVRSGGGGGAAPGSRSGSPTSSTSDYEKKAQAALQAHMDKARKEVQEQLQKDRAYYQQKTAEGVKALNKASSSALSELDALDAAEAAPSRARAPRQPSEDEQSLDIYARSSSDALNSLVGNGDLTSTADPGSLPPSLLDSGQLATDVTQPDNFTPLSPDSLLPPDNADGTSSLRDYGGFGPKADGDKDMPANPDDTSPTAPGAKTGDATAPGKDKPFDPQQGLPGSDATSPDGSAPAASMKARDTPAADGPMKDPQQPAQTAPRDFDSLTPKEQTDINRRTDELWAQKNGLPPGTKIDPQADPDAAKAWMAQRQEVMQSGSQGPPSAAATVVPTTTGTAPAPQAAVAAAPAEQPPAPAADDAAPAPAPAGGASMPAAQPQPADGTETPAVTVRSVTPTGPATPPPAATQQSFDGGVSGTVGPMKVESTAGGDTTGSSRTINIGTVNQNGDNIAGGSVKNTNAPDGTMGFEGKAKVGSAEYTYVEQRKPDGTTATSTEIKAPIPGTPASIIVGGGTTADGGRQVTVGAGAEGSIHVGGMAKVGGSADFKATVTGNPVNSTNDPQGNYAPGTNRSVNINLSANFEGTASVGGTGAKATYGIQQDYTITSGITTIHAPKQMDQVMMEMTINDRGSDPEVLGQVARMAEIAKAEYARTNNPSDLQLAQWYVQQRNSLEARQRDTAPYKEYMRERCIASARVLEANPRFQYNYTLQQQALEFRHQALLYARELQK